MPFGDRTGPVGAGTANRQRRRLLWRLRNARLHESGPRCRLRAGCRLGRGGGGRGWRHRFNAAGAPGRGHGRWCGPYGYGAGIPMGWQQPVYPPHRPTVRKPQDSRNSRRSATRPVLERCAENIQQRIAELEADKEDDETGLSPILPGIGGPWSRGPGLHCQINPNNSAPQGPGPAALTSQGDRSMSGSSPDSMIPPSRIPLLSTSPPSPVLCIPALSIDMGVLSMFPPSPRTGSMSDRSRLRSTSAPGQPLPRRPGGRNPRGR